MWWCGLRGGRGPSIWGARLVFIVLLAGIALREKATRMGRPAKVRDDGAFKDRLIKWWPRSQPEISQCYVCVLGAARPRPRRTTSSQRRFEISFLGGFISFAPAVYRESVLKSDWQFKWSPVRPSVCPSIRMWAEMLLLLLPLLRGGGRKMRVLAFYFLHFSRLLTFIIRLSTDASTR